MSRAKTFNTVMILGSGPITIGQACEFDYSGTQACRALKEEGYKVILLNSNPATIMTDPGVADRTYIEPLDPSVVIEILRKEGVDAILPTMGGQTALNIIMNLANIPHALDGVEIIGANLRAIHLAENRRAFRELVESLGMDSPRSAIIRNIDDARAFVEDVGFPFILRPSFTLGGSGQSIVFSSEELIDKTNRALEYSPIGEALVEESVKGWKEFELEVMRDRQDNAIVVCSIENLDPMGVHTGDSITVAPQQTLTDREYQAMRWEALRLIRAVGVETGGCNVQFAVNPLNGRRVVIEMNPRVSRSSALASKATGFPIAYVATKLAIGYNLSEVDNRITLSTKACFEPPIDYVALKIPRFHFEKFPGAIDELLPQMQSVGEVLSFGTSLGEAYHKALNSLERKWPQFKPVDSQNPQEAWSFEKEDLLIKAHSKRSFAVWDALACGVSPEEVAHWMEWDPWFTRQLKLYQEENSLGPRAINLSKDNPHFEMIDTCSGENRVQTSYFYSTRENFSFESPQNPYLETQSLALPKDKRGRAVILGSGPNRIGQGVEFDYCCVHASLALLKLGFETVMINCNPETVSTDPTTSTRLYLEPLHEDSVRAILEKELGPLKAAGQEAFVVIQMGGQTPLKLASKIESWGYKLLGTTQQSIDLCEDREKFAKFLKKNNIHYPSFASATTLEESIKVVKKIGYPVLVRPSYVLGGRGMKICYSDLELTEAFHAAKQVNSDFPLYLDKYLKDAIEYDIDGLCDGKKAWVAGVMEHVEEAGIHSGDSSCVIPPFRLPASKIDEMAGIAKKIAVGSGGKGFFNIQMAVVGEDVFVIEANPRASRTVPFLAKATGYSLVEWAIRSALGEESVSEIVKEAPIPGNYRLPSHGYAVKTPVFPFEKFRNVDPILGPEMRSTGEVMGVGPNAGDALAKSFLASGVKLPEKGGILLSVKDRDKNRLLPIARGLSLMGFRLLGTPGTSSFLVRAGIDCEQVQKIGQAPMGQDLLHFLQSSKVQMVVNTTETAGSFKDGESIRQIALRLRIPLMSTISAAEMALMAIERLKKGHIPTVCLQDFIAGAQLTQV
jgi:carbamoyl-phosphate synthase large subunit